MRSHNRNIYKQGNIAAGLLALIGVAAMTLIFSQIETFKIKSTQEKVIAAKNLVSIQNAIEVFMMAYRTNQTIYYSIIHERNQTNPAECPNPKSFLEALDKGHGCTNSYINLFSNGMPAGDDPYTETGSNVYSYESGCEIANSDSDCTRTIEDRVLLTIGYNNDDQKIGGAKYKIFLQGFVYEKSMAEFRIEFLEPGSVKVQKKYFAVVTDVRDLAHVEFDTRIVRDSIDPMNPCPNKLWGQFSFLDSTTKQCSNFGQLGAGTGLAFYKERFFMFRANDGTVVDIGYAGGSSHFGFDAISTLSVMNTVLEVNENGLSSTGIHIFPHYQKNLLIGARDIEVVGNQVFYVEGQGPGANLGYIRFDTLVPQREKVCSLGEMGWATSFKGIAAASWSDELQATSGGGPVLGPSSGTISRPRIASFTLKTSSGDVLNATVVQHPNKGNGLRCVVTRNEIASKDIENKRTNGITRVWDKVPYWIY